MARIAATSSDETLAHAASAVRVAHLHSSSRFKYIPGFLYILVLYIVGKFMFSDPRAIFIEWGQYQLTWVEVLHADNELAAALKKRTAESPQMQAAERRAHAAQARYLEAIEALVRVKRYS